MNGSPGFGPAIEAYYESMAALARRLMEIFALALRPSPGWFDPLIDAHGSALHLANYPAGGCRQVGTGQR